MADVTTPEKMSTCCAPKAQESCCEPSEKAACCAAGATDGTCGCSAGAAPVAGARPTRRGSSRLP
jgi:arsenite methyltransferase